MSAFWAFEMRDTCLLGRCAAALTLICASALPLCAQEGIVAGLSQNRVAITTDFSGSEILIYGAIKRDSPVPQDAPPLAVVITVEGPSEPLIVRKKARRFGIWVNTEQVRIAQAPSFYAIATSHHLDEALLQTDDLRFQVTVPRAIRAIGIAGQAEQAPDFIEALIRLRSEAGLYRLSENSVALSETTLFRTDVTLPADLTEGSYLVRIFLTRGGAVIDQIEQEIDVQKEGIERFLYTLARNQPFIYGLLSLLIAVVAGWGASKVSRLFRR